MPIVALTGHRDGELVDEALDAGAVGHVLKPFHDRELVETLRIALTERGVGTTRTSVAGSCC